MSDKKKKALLKGEKPATPAVAAAIETLLEIRRERLRLTHLSQEMQNIILDADGGCAHGYRAYVRIIAGGSTYRRVTVKPGFRIVMVPYITQEAAVA